MMVDASKAVGTQPSRARREQELLMPFKVRVYGRTLIGAAAIALVAAATTSAASASDLINVTIDFAKVMKLDRPAATIVVGNPGIADATVEDEHDTGAHRQDRRHDQPDRARRQGPGDHQFAVRVSSNVQQLTTVFYGGERQTFSCSPGLRAGDFGRRRAEFVPERHAADPDAPGVRQPVSSASRRVYNEVEFKRPARRSLKLFREISAICGSQ